MIIDAKNKVLGRLATRVAREAKDGEEVHVVNSEKAVISGSEEEIKDEYQTKHDRGTRHDGPYYPKAPDRILKRAVRGMLPYKSSEGSEAFERVRTYIGVPHELEEAEEVDAKEGTDLKHRNYVKLREVSKSMGWEKRVNPDE